ncbi:MAG: transposase [delta proteobacterium MLS_D]|jgi:transposase|nr:MAG: transposase [delta proteobacterium MLS_D]
MRRTELLQETRKMRFEELYTSWTDGHVTQEQAALVLGVCDRTFRRYINRYEEDGLEGLSDKRLTQASHRRAPVDEVMKIADTYRQQHRGWNVNHYYSWYRRAGGTRSYTWVKNTLQSEGLVTKSRKRGSHRIKRDRAHLPGVMIHQDGSRHEWVPGCMWDLIVTMDDATGEHYSMFFVDEEGTDSSFQGVRNVILQRGLFSSFYSDRGSHYWYTPREGGKVSKTQLTQFGRAMKQLGILMIPAYSPEARGRSERVFSTHQDRLVKELAFQGITTMTAANRYLNRVYRPAYNAEFMQPAPEEGTAFVPWTGDTLDDILCYQEERTVRADNCVTFEGKLLQIPADQYRCHYVRVKVRVHRYIDGTLALFHGPRKLADYDAQGTQKNKTKAA